MQMGSKPGCYTKHHQSNHFMLGGTWWRGCHFPWHVPCLHCSIRPLHSEHSHSRDSLFNLNTNYIDINFYEIGSKILSWSFIIKNTRNTTMISFNRKQCVFQYSFQTFRKNIPIFISMFILRP